MEADGNNLVSEHDPHPIPGVRPGFLGSTPTSQSVRVGLWGLVLCGFTLVASSCSKGGPHSLSGGAQGMNVVLVVADTLRADRLSCYGYPERTTPHLDELAETGVLFENAFVQCNFSGGSYASIFTGMYAHHHGVRDHPMTLDRDLVTLAEVLEDHGYVTFGRHSHPLLDDKWQYRQGFEDYGAVRRGERSAQDFARFLEERGEERFFAFIQLMEPHYSYVPPPRFGPDGNAKPVGFDQRLRGVASKKNELMFGFDGLGLTRGDFEYLCELYEGEVRYTDWIVGRVTEALKNRGLAENTVVVFFADHGEALGEHGECFNHDASLYDPVMRVPFVVSNPSLFPSSQRVEEQVREIDLFDSILDLVGIPSPGNDGASVLSLLDGGVEDRPSFAEGRPLDASRLRLREAALGQGLPDPIPNYRMSVAGIEGKWRSVRTRSHKLISIPTQEGMTWEFYDVLQDPGETRNLMGDPSAEEKRIELVTLLEEWILEDRGASGTVPNTREVFERLKNLGYAAGEFSDETQESETGEGSSDSKSKRGGG